MHSDSSDQEAYERYGVSDITRLQREKEQLMRQTVTYLDAPDSCGWWWKIKEFKNGCRHFEIAFVSPDAEVNPEIPAYWRALLHESAFWTFEGYKWQKVVEPVFKD